MKNQLVISRLLIFVLVVFQLLGCSAGPGGPTATPIPVEPQPGALINAKIATGEKASSGTISFSVSESGTGITNLIITLNDANCNDAIIMGRVSDFWSHPPIRITDGKFSASRPAMGGQIENFTVKSREKLLTVDDPEQVGRLEGRFTSPTEASGTITIYLSVPFSELVCELGTFDWSTK